MCGFKGIGRRECVVGDVCCFNMESIRFVCAYRNITASLHLLDV